MNTRALVAALKPQMTRPYRWLMTRLPPKAWYVIILFNGIVLFKHPFFLKKKFFLFLNVFITRVFLLKQAQTNEPMAFSVVDDSRRTVIARQALRKQESALLRNTAAQNGVLAPNAQGPVSLETQNATDLAALSRANAAMPARIRNYADAVARLDTIVENLGPIRRHYGHPIVIDSKFILFNARQRLFRYCWVEGGVGRWLVLQFLSSHSNFISGAISSLVNAYNSSGHKTGSTCFFFVFFFCFLFFFVH